MRLLYNNSGRGKLHNLFSCYTNLDNKDFCKEAIKLIKDSRTQKTSFCLLDAAVLHKCLQNEKDIFNIDGLKLVGRSKNKLVFEIANFKNTINRKITNNRTKCRGSMKKHNKPIIKSEKETIVKLMGIVLENICEDDGEYICNIYASPTIVRKFVNHEKVHYYFSDSNAVILDRNIKLTSELLILFRNVTHHNNIVVRNKMIDYGII